MNRRTLVGIPYDLPQDECACRNSLGGGFGPRQAPRASLAGSGAILPHRRTIQRSRRTIQRSRRTIQRSRRTIQLSRRMTQRPRRTIQRSRRMPQRSHRTTQRSRRTIQRSRRMTQRSRRMTQRSRRMSQRSRRMTQRHHWTALRLLVAFWVNSTRSADAPFKAVEDARPSVSAATTRSKSAPSAAPIAHRFSGG